MALHIDSGPGKGPDPGPKGDPESDPRDGPAGGLQILLDIFPLGLFVGGLAAITRGLLVVASGAEGPGADQTRSFQLLALVERWPEVLTEAIVAAVVAVLVLDAANRTRKPALSLLAVTVSVLALGAFLGDALASTPGGAFLPGLGPPVVAASIGIALLAFGINRLGFRGVVPLIVGALLGIVLPIGLALSARGSLPGMPIRVVLIDLVAAPDLFTTIAARELSPPGPGVLTPAVDQRTDTGDKPSLVLPPPAAQEFTVPKFARNARVIAAAGADNGVVMRLPAGLDELRVVYRIRVDGDVVWEDTIAHRQMPPGTFDTTGMQWRHVEVDGVSGLPVEPGQVVRFETDFAPGQDLAGLSEEGLRLGFGGATLERTYEEPRRVARPDAPNIIFVVMDTLRRDRLTCYGYGRPTTPRLDAFAAQGLRFTDVYSTSSWTWPSTASLMTGLLPDAHGVKSSSACTLSQRLGTLAEALQARGYTTAAFSGNPIVEPDRYFDQGFESFDVVVPEFRMSDVVVPPALEWLEQHAPVRFFLYLHLVDPHEPHRPHPEEVARLGLAPAPADWPEAGFRGIYRKSTPSDDVKAYASDLYDTSVATGDRWFGVILDKLEDLGLTDSTIVVFTSDHGEELFDHGFHGHGYDVHSELVRVPLIIRGPGIPRGVRTGVVSNRFIPTTLAALAGARLEGSGENVHLIDDTLPGEALFETTKGDWNGAKYQQLYGLRRGADVTQWRASETALSEIPATDLRRFDALGDPFEQSDLVQSAVEAARRDVARIRELVEAAEELRPPLILGVGAQGRSQLHGMGYSGDDDE